jgi:asparagine synthase (glutamine-hydrolysing)
MLDQLAHRGPDGGDVWCDPKNAATLGCARLATTDLSDAAHQPLATSDHRFVLVFNGYIAGHRRQIADGIKDGMPLQTQSDAELVLQLLARAVRNGKDIAQALATLSGQYALAFWDRQQSCLWLARDPLGIKPLYVRSMDVENLAFASELSALGAVGRLEHDEQVKARYQAHLFVPAPESGMRDVELLEPGTVLCWQDGHISRSRIKLTSLPRKPSKNISDVVKELRNAVRQSVADAMDADCAVGCLVSGGIDSAGVSALACDIARERGQALPPGFVMGFDDPARDETGPAETLCRSLGQDLQVIAAPASPAEIHQALLEGLKAVGAPFANPSLVLMGCLSRAVGQHVRVCLAGDGGDELFGGYPRYRAANLFDRYWRHIPRWLRSMPIGLGGVWGRRDLDRFLRGGAGTSGDAFACWNDRCAIPECGSVLEVPSHLPGQKHGLAQRMMAFDQNVTLPGNQLLMSDRCGMAYGLEYRVPLLGHDVVRIARSIATSDHLKGQGKNIWRQAVRSYLPTAQQDRQKIGFNPPVAEWLKGLAHYRWGSDADILAAIFDQTAITRENQILYWRRAISGRDIDMALSVWALMVWRIWQGMDQTSGSETSRMRTAVDFA